MKDESPPPLRLLSRFFVYCNTVARIKAVRHLPFIAHPAFNFAATPVCPVFVLHAEAGHGGTSHFFTIRVAFIPSIPKELFRI